MKVIIQGNNGSNAGADLDLVGGSAGNNANGHLVMQSGDKVIMLLIVLLHLLSID